MPREFQQYFGKKATVIIDCFELLTEMSSYLKARAQTFSNYKHHNTIKYLIGITPQGVVSYISSGWRGRTNDKCLTENCSFLDNLLPGDLVLADRGFNIQESVGLICAEVKIPAFTKGKKQLSAFDVDIAMQQPLCLTWDTMDSGGGGGGGGVHHFKSKMHS